MNNEEIKIGDTVRLKSGGPPLTVDGYTPDFDQKFLVCSYFHHGRLIRETLPATSLMKIEVK